MKIASASTISKNNLTQSYKINEIQEQERYEKEGKCLITPEVEGA